MNSILIYLFQVSLVFGSFYLVYKWLFSRFTFHTFNRIILVSLVPLSLVLPLSNKLFPKITYFTFEIPLIKDFAAFSSFDYLFTEETIITQTESIHWSFWLLCVYGIGVLCYLVKFAFTTYRIVQLKRNAQKAIVNGTTVYIGDTTSIFSYFHWIFIPKSTKESCDALIITHEKAHIHQWHSVDVILVELFIAFYWFHPLAYLYRKSLKSIHEFQADAFVLQQKVKKSTYLELLLQSLEPTQTNPVYNYFSHPTLKKRIEMITKSQSKSKLKYLYLLLIPTVAFVFMAFRTTETTLEKIPVLTSTQTLENDLTAIPSISPIHKQNRQRFSAMFGVKRKHPKLKHVHKHGGIDIVAKVGAPVIATAQGVIAKAKNEGNWGNLVVITHADGFETWYAHLQGFAVEKHAVVKKGDTIGYVGNTGLSTGPHLHYEVHQDGKRLDPMKYITE